MRRLVILFSIICCTYKASAQPLVANGNLNDRNTCTEYKVLCAPEAWFFIPSYIVVPQEKEPGDYFEELSMGSVLRFIPGSRNYIYTKILCTLAQGQAYKFSVWINTGGNLFDHLDVYLSAAEPGRDRSSSARILQPTFTLTSANEDSSKKWWKKYSYTYTAKGGEQFLMAGNLSNEAMDRRKNKILSMHYTVLYAIDDFMLTAVDSNTKTCPEYNAVVKQVYDQNHRHPPGFIEDVELDSKLLPLDTTRKKEITWIVVDTPPTLKRVSDTLVIPDVLFLFNSSKLNPAFTKDLDDIIEKLKNLKFTGLEVTGHTDSIGTAAYNMRLSQDRAGAIKNYLETKLQIADALITTKGFGATKPIATNQTAEGRQKNRRVEIILQH